MVDRILASYPTEMRSVLQEARRVPVFDIQGNLRPGKVT